MEKKKNEVLIKRLLDEWQKDTNTFVETRAAKHVLECIQKNSVVTITASSGVGKTATLRYVALKMADEGYNVLPVTNPIDIGKLYNLDHKTLFVIDDFCGTYLINQSDVNSWDPIMEQIQVLMQNKLTKVIVACRLQVYQDEQFESLSLFRTNECNLLSKELCLSPTEMYSIAKLYLDTKAEEIIQYSDVHDCFPLLCKLYHANSLFNIAEYFSSPFAQFAFQIHQLYAEGYYGKVCALALCVMFNNRLEEKWLTGVLYTEETTTIIHNTLEACKLDRVTSQILLIDELDSLLGTFLKKEQGVYKAVHDAVFDFLVYCFGQKYILPLMINYAVSEVIMQRLVLELHEQMDVIPQFTTVIPHKYHQLFFNRMIQDWLQRRVQCVFHNINMKVFMFRQRFHTFLCTLDLRLQNQLAHTCDVNNNETVLSFCSSLGDIRLVYWCLEHGADVNKCDSFGLSPLYISARKGYTEIVKLLLDNKAYVDKCIGDGTSPLFVSCQNNHTDIVRLLLEKGAYYDKCNKKGISPKQIASKNENNDIIALINKHSR